MVRATGWPTAVCLFTSILGSVLCSDPPRRVHDKANESVMSTHVRNFYALWTAPDPIPISERREIPGKSTQGITTLSLIGP